MTAQILKFPRLTNRRLVDRQRPGVCQLISLVYWREHRERGTLGNNGPDPVFGAASQPAHFGA